MCVDEIWYANWILYPLIKVYLQRQLQFALCMYVYCGIVVYDKLLLMSISQFQLLSVSLPLIQVHQCHVSQLLELMLKWLYLYIFNVVNCAFIILLQPKFNARLIGNKACTWYCSLISCFLSCRSLALPSLCAVYCVIAHSKQRVYCVLYFIFNIYLHMFAKKAEGVMILPSHYCWQC